jgi:hypothetical protein
MFKLLPFRQYTILCFELHFQFFFMKISINLEACNSNFYRFRQTKRTKRTWRSVKIIISKTHVSLTAALSALFISCIYDGCSILSWTVSLLSTFFNLRTRVFCINYFRFIDLTRELYLYNSAKIWYTVNQTNCTDEIISHRNSLVFFVNGHRLH